MFIVNPLSNGCENTSASSMAADSCNAAAGVYRSWKWASAVVATRPPSAAAKSRAAGRGLLLNVAAVDRDDVPLPAVELDPEVDFRLREREIALVAHLAVDEHLAGLVEHVHGHADGLAAVAEPAFAGDRLVTVVEAVANRVVGVDRRRRQCKQRERRQNES